MEIKRVPVLAVLLAVVIVAPVVFAETAGLLRGSIVSIDLSGRKMDIRSQDGKIVTVPVDPAARITLNGQNTTFSGLSVGQAVSIQRTSRNGQSLATSIEVLPAAPGASSSSSPSSSAIPSPAAPGGSSAAPGGSSSFPSSGASPSSSAPSPGSSLPNSSPSSSGAGSMGSSSPSGSSSSIGGASPSENPAR